MMKTLLFLFVMGLATVLNGQRGTGIRISQPGFGCSMIEWDGFRICVDLADVVADSLDMSGFDDVDLFLVTHDDWDHFSPSCLAEMAGSRKALVIGPPTIAYPLLADHAFPPEKLTVAYPPLPGEPWVLDTMGLKLKMYQSTHFNNWNPVHVSYLLERGGRRIFITGDSYSYLDDVVLKDGTDVLIANMVEGQDPEPYIDLIRRIGGSLQYACLLPAHLINCEFTLSPVQLARSVALEGLSDVRVLSSPEEVFTLGD